MPYDIIIGRSEKDRDKYGTKACVFLGRQYVKMGAVTSLSNNVYLDVNRSHVVFICGKRGSGKCITGDTLISLADGRTLPIKDIKNEEILCLNENFKISPARKEGFFKRKANKILKIKLRSGKELKCTPEHPLLTIRGWKEALEIPLHGRIATPRKINFFGNSDLTEAETKILAYLIAEGHLKKDMFFSNKDEFIVKDLENSLKELHPDIELMKLNSCNYKINSRKIKRKVLECKNIIDEKGRFCKGSSIIHEKRAIRIFLEEHKIYGLLSGKKFIPEKIISLPKHMLSLFLNRLFSCDGSIYKHKTGKSYCWEISYGSKSEKLIKQVQHLLLKFGILSRLREKIILLNKKQFLNYELVVNSESVYNFINEIGFFGIKELKQKQALKETKIINPNVDTIPKEIWYLYRPKNWAAVGKEFGYKTGKSLRSSINYGPSRQKLLQIAIADQSKDMQLLAESDIFWDEIIEKEELNGEFDVYDISVPSHHNFVANDIIIHNSYTMGVIAEGISDLPEEIADNISVIMLDTMGIYWTMKYPNRQDSKMIVDWNLRPKGLNVQIYTPVGYYDEYKKKGIPTDFPFSIKPSELSSEDWCNAFEISRNDPIGVLIEKTINFLKENEADYSLQDIIDLIKKDEGSDFAVRAAAENRFINAKSWGLFSEQGTAIKDIAQPGKVSVLDVSCYSTQPGSWGIKSLVIGIVSQKLFIERMVARKNEEYQSIKEAVHYFSEEKKGKTEMPLVWLVIDEAHEFLPFKGKTAASDALITILREGREPGISLILASQQPGKIHTDVMTQADTVIAHRVTAKLDVDALGTLMQSYMREGLVGQLNNLPSDSGAAIIFDDTNERLYPMRVRPRFTWHGGSAPVALRTE